MNAKQKRGKKHQKRMESKKHRGRAEMKRRYHNLFKKFWIDGPHPESMDEKQIYWVFLAMWDLLLFDNRPASMEERRRIVHQAVSHMFEKPYVDPPGYNNIGKASKDIWTDNVMYFVFGERPS